MNRCRYSCWLAWSFSLFAWWLCEPFQSESLCFQFGEIFFLCSLYYLVSVHIFLFVFILFGRTAFSVAASSYLRVRHLKPEIRVWGSTCCRVRNCQICCRWTAKCQFIDFSSLWQVFPQKESLHSGLQPTERVERAHCSGWSFLISHVSQQDTSSLFSAVFSIHESRALSSMVATSHTQLVKFEWAEIKWEIQFLWWLLFDDGWLWYKTFPSPQKIN